MTGVTRFRSKNYRRYSIGNTKTYEGGLINNTSLCITFKLVDIN